MKRRQSGRYAGEALKALLQMTEQGSSTATHADGLVNAHVWRHYLTLLQQRALQIDVAGVLIWLSEQEPLQPKAIVGLSASQEEQWWKISSTRPLCLYVDAATARHLQAGEACSLPPIWSSPSLSGASKRLLVPLGVQQHRFVGLLDVEYRELVLPEEADQEAFIKAFASLLTPHVEHEAPQRKQEEVQIRLFDMYEEKQREEKRRMEEFIGVASHELKTPLTSAMLHLDMAAHVLGKRSLHTTTNPNARGELERLKTLLSKAQEQMRRQQRLVSSLLDVSRIRHQRLDLQIADYDLGTLVSEVVEEYRLMHPARVIELYGVVHELGIRGDADRIRQVVSNYLSNALKYSPDSHPVEVHVRIEASNVRVSVQDTGLGLAQEEQTLIWQQFYRVLHSQVQRAGLGLGLYICRTIIEQHAGQVGVQSVPGEGSTFWFTLPLP